MRRLHEREFPLLPSERNIFNLCRRYPAGGAYDEDGRTSAYTAVVHLYTGGRTHQLFCVLNCISAAMSSSIVVDGP